MLSHAPHLELLLQQAQQQQTDSSNSSSAACTRRPIEVSHSMAAARAAESSLPDGLFTDPFAAQLLDTQQQQQQQQDEALLDVIATRYIDESLLNAMAATNVNSIQSGDYRQVRRPSTSSIQASEHRQQLQGVPGYSCLDGECHWQCLNALGT
jgi:hypothetical protein